MKWYSNILRNLEVGSVGVGAGFCMYDVVVNKFMFAISSPGEFLLAICCRPSVCLSVCL